MVVGANSMSGGIDKISDEEADTNKFLAQRLRELIETYGRTRDESKSVSRKIKITGIVIAGATTILIGLNGYFLNKALLSMVALVCSAATTMLSAWDAVEGHTWKWVSYRTILCRLRTIKDEFDFMKASKGTVEGDDAKRMFELIQEALKESNDSWMHTRANNILAGAQPKGQA